MKLKDKKVSNCYTSDFQKTVSSHLNMYILVITYLFPTSLGRAGNSRNPTPDWSIYLAIDSSLVPELPASW